MKQALMQKLRLIFKDNLSSFPQDLQQYGKDLSVDAIANPAIIVFPTSTEEVAALVKLANEEKLALVPSGGRTGYSGGAVANNNEIVVSFDNMLTEFSFDEPNALLTCSAGYTLKTIQNEAAKHGLLYPVNIASKDRCQIGGNIATNAGGIHVIKYGMTRSWVRGLEVVTGKGDILQLNNGLCKNNAGYDLMQMFIGSEGTLGFITKATLLFTANRQQTYVTTLIGIDHFSDLATLFQKLYTQIDIKAIEFFTQHALNALIHIKHYDLPLTHEYPYYLIINHQQFDQLNTLLKALNISNQQFITEEDEEKQQDLWKYRLEISRSLSNKHPYKFDIAVLPANIYKFIQTVNQYLEKHFDKENIIWFGHVGDGNVHLNILKDDNIELSDFQKKCQQVTDTIYTIVKQFKGTVSAEHGIGITKKAFLPFSKSDAEINYMKSIKQVFDPNHIMNPGKIF